jgi:hypothetical protein
MCRAGSDNVSDLRCRRSSGRVGALVPVAIGGLFGLVFALPLNVTTVRRAEAQPRTSSEQRAVIAVRDTQGTKDAPIPLGVQVQAPTSEAVLVTVQFGDLPKDGRVSDGRHTAVATKERDVIDVTGWDLANTTFSPPPGVTGQFTLALTVTVETGARPLLAQASFIVTIGDGRRPLPSGPLRTVHAEVTADQIAVRTSQEASPPEQLRPVSGGPAPGPDASAPPRTAVRQAAPGDSIAEALARDRKLWLEREQARTETLTRQLVAAHEQIGGLKAKVAAPGSDPVNPPDLKDADLTLLLSKANELIRPGDVSGARLLLERAFETGSAEAAFYLAQTYDPRILESWNVQGIRPDPEKARELYNLAHEGGVTKAKEMGELMR